MEHTATHACAVFGNPADLYDVVDFNKRCREAEGVHLALARSFGLNTHSFCNVMPAWPGLVGT